MSEPETTRVDMHVKILDDRVVSRANASGLDMLVYAPHFTRLHDVQESAARYSDDELTVVPAREVFTGSWRNRRHLLALGLREPVPDFITLEAALAEFERQDAAVLVPHPTLLTVSLGDAEVARYRESIHAVETYNTKSLTRDNRRAQAIAERHGIPGFASSYAHLLGSVGEAWTTFEGALDSSTDLVDALRRGLPRRSFRRGGLGHRVRGLAEYAHLGLENSWGKVDRLFLSGMEPTHPDNIAYDGRFDDVKVY